MLKYGKNIVKILRKYCENVAKMLRKFCENVAENIVKLLIEKYNVNINGIDYIGSTALHRASGWNQPHIIEYLHTLF